MTVQPAPRSKIARFFPLALLSVAAAAALALSLGPFESRRGGEPRVIDVTAYQFGFEPNRVTVQAGEPVVFRVTARDVMHGFFIDGTDVKADIPPHVPQEIGPLTFDRPAKLKIRCASFCGPLHPFMVADLVVESGAFPYFWALVGLALLVAFGMLGYIWKLAPTDSLLGVPTDRSVDLLKVRWFGPRLRKFLQWRPSHFWILLPNLWVFMVIFTTATVGNPMGALNFSITVIWLLWFCLVEFMILFGGRLWCLMCPMPVFGEWIARERLALGPQFPLRFLSLNRPWPKWLEHSWVASIGFLGMSLPIVWLVTRPAVTGMLFIGLTLVALVIPLIFDGGHRRFCRHLCPAFYLGYHATTSAVAVEPADEELCKKHLCKECMNGNSRGFGCPWGQYPGGKGPKGKDSAIHCNLCHECVKSCSLGNMTVKLRMPAKEVVDKVRAKPDEAWQGFIRLSLAVLYEFVFFGSWFWVKDWGNMGHFQGANLLAASELIPSGQGFLNWLKWCLIVGSLALVIVPALFFVFVALAHAVNGAKEKPAVRRVFLALSYALSPFGQLLWASFGLALLVVNWAYPLKAFGSDPLGWGWNWLGLEVLSPSAHQLYAPAAAQWLPYVQFVFAIVALALVLQVTFQLAHKLYAKETRAALRTTLVMSGFYVPATVAFMGVFLG